jgi:hypothetical protein
MNGVSGYLTYAAPILGAAYLGIMVYLAKQLELRHPAAWVSVGRFSLSTWSIVNSVLFATYVLCRGAHRKLNDPKVSYLVYLARITFVLAIACLILFPGTHN